MKYESLHEAVVLVCRSPASKKAKYLVRLCGPDERWTGLWDFPRFELPQGSAKSINNKSINNRAIDSKAINSKAQLATLLNQHILKTTGLQVETSSTSIALKHAVTRFRITLDVFQTSTVSGRLNKTNGQTYQWATIDELKLLAMSTTGRKVASQLPLDTA
jgi:A/G-specific adenine glycosylase